MPIPARLLTSVKLAFAVVSIEHLVVVGKVRHQNVDTAVVQVISGSQAHSRHLASILVQGKPGDVALIVKRPVSLVHVEKIGF